MNLTSNNTIELPLSSYLELDSHADTSCAGSNCRVLEYTNKTCTVSSFSSKQTKVRDVPIVTAATAYDAPNGEIYILILNQSLYLGEHMQHSLMCPNQARSHGVIVEDVPRHLSPEENKSTHSITFTEENISIPLELNGYISRLSTRYPTMEEIENCQWLTLTSPTEWDPYDPMFSENELVLSHHDHLIPAPRTIFALSRTIVNEPQPFSDHTFYDDLITSPMVTYHKACQIQSAQSGSRKFE
jgi:hypothetical protein